VRALLDTCVASLRAEDAFLSVISLGEIVRGIERLPSSRKKSNLRGFLERLESQFSSRILGVDLETARIWGEVTARAAARGEVVPPTDGLIAATAVRHGLHVFTRNIRDFAPTGALTLNPWEDPST